MNDYMSVVGVVGFTFLGVVSQMIAGAAEEQLEQAKWNGRSVTCFLLVIVFLLGSLVEKLK